MSTHTNQVMDMHMATRGKGVTCTVSGDEDMVISSDMGNGVTCNGF